MPDGPTPRATKQALKAAQGWVVPLYSGGVQIEWHQDGIDLEIEFTSEGVIANVFWGRADAVG